MSVLALDERESTGTMKEHQFAQDQDDEEIVDIREPHPGDGTNSDQRDPSHSSMFGDITVFRDFFLAAFSDGYYSLGCCGNEGFFPGSCCHSESNHSGIKRGCPDDCTTRSMGSSSSNAMGLPKSPSYDSRRQHRKKPLAIAVGFNYAEDMNGRPIVITPGTRRPPLELNKSKIGAAHSAVAGASS